MLQVSCFLPEEIVELQAAGRAQQRQVPSTWLDGHVRSGGRGRAAADAADGRLHVHAGQVHLLTVT